MPSKTTDAQKAAKKAAKQVTGTSHLVVLMDETGSMTNLREAVVTGCNEFLHTFKDKGDVRVWLAMFDAHPDAERTRFKFKGEKIKKVTDLGIDDYSPRGMTPLNDAIIDTITTVSKAATKDETVFIAIITDGMENASEMSAEDVRKVIAKHERKGWGFVFLGANQHSETTAAGLGLHGKGKAMNFNASRGGVRSTMRSTSDLASARIAAGPGVQGQKSYLNMAEATYDSLVDGKLEDLDDDE